MHPSARLYNNIALWFYDYLVHSIFMVYGWHCPTKSVGLPFFSSHVGPKHMDVGVGTGYFPVAVRKSSRKRNGQLKPQWPQKLMLVDLNPNCTAMAATRVGAPDCTETLTADVLQPIPAAGKHETFDSLSLMNVLHCLPGTSESKAQAFGHLKPFLKEDGVLFGSTILGRGVEHNRFGRLVMWLSNSLGIFHNYGDHPDDFVRALQKDFNNVEHVVVGRVLLFTAKEPN